LVGDLGGGFLERIGLALCAVLVFPFSLFLPRVNPGSTLRNKGFGGGAVVGGSGVCVRTCLLPSLSLSAASKGETHKKERIRISSSKQLKDKGV